MKKSIILMLMIIMAALSPSQIFAQGTNDVPEMFQEANKHFAKGEYNESVKIYDDVLEIVPDNVSTLKMKGIALSNMGFHEKSLKQFYKIIQKEPDNVIALTGMGVGFGYLGEYHEAKQYFKRALAIYPNNTVIKNYNDFVDSVITKYPYTPTEKPEPVIVKPATIPLWVKSNAKWWSDGGIEDSDFVTGIQFLIDNKIMQINLPHPSDTSSQSIPDWVKNNAGWWADGLISDQDFLSGIYFMIQNGIMIINIEKSLEEIEKERSADFWLFERYLSAISKNVANEKRYIEFPNPSFDVIKKFLRDYVIWNFDAEAAKAATKFPDPVYEIVNGTYIIQYKIYVNEQPSGLPLDHVSTFENSLHFWQAQDFNVNNQKAKVDFSYTDKKHEANVWVTWVVRDLGEGVLGHAHVGKGVVEVALGDYSCDGSFQLYDVKSVETIMTHELGHSVGLQHDDDPNSIMFPSFEPSHAYCLLN